MDHPVDGHSGVVQARVQDAWRARVVDEREIAGHGQRVDGFAVAVEIQLAFALAVQGQRPFAGTVRDNLVRAEPQRGLGPRVGVDAGAGRADDRSARVIVVGVGEDDRRALLHDEQGPDTRDRRGHFCAAADTPAEQVGAGCAGRDAAVGMQGQQAGVVAETAAVQHECIRLKDGGHEAQRTVGFGKQVAVECLDLSGEKIGRRVQAENALSVLRQTVGAGQHAVDVDVTVTDRAQGGSAQRVGLAGQRPVTGQVVGVELQGRQGEGHAVRHRDCAACAGKERRVAGSRQRAALPHGRVVPTSGSAGPNGIGGVRAPDKQ